jgi:hypothetical protein
MRVTGDTTKRIRPATASTSVSNPVCRVSLMILLTITSVDLNPVLRVDYFPMLLGCKLRIKRLTRLKYSATVTATSTRSEVENQKIKAL